ncbi:uncharacterized protein LOC110462720 [Mizuhopecten yessoensis]|uniref:uncharacterized protein LOC110462720 n=1 Tax=Mizuhopecten yessoensis TaxID=6573 RepID=UPI000B45ED95|nr:uncharacterized protein LOC110462720 [Mizuhopecten yessoensis]
MKHQKIFECDDIKFKKALTWLKSNNPAYTDIIISDERLSILPLDSGIEDMENVEFLPSTEHADHKGPSEDQINLGEDVDGDTSSSVLLPEPVVDIHKKVHKIIENALNKYHSKSGEKTHKKITIPWPTRSDIPLSEFTTQHFFTLAFPTLFPFGTGDFCMNRPRTCESLAEWADHLLWIDNGRFAHHQYFKSVVHNMIMRKRALERGNFVFKQQLGDCHLTLDQQKQQIQKGDTTIANKLLYFGASFRGSNQYWAERGKELRSLMKYKINEGSGLPSFFTTGSCAEFHFPSLRRFLSIYVRETTGYEPDLTNRNTVFRVLQENTHFVAHFFDLRTRSYFQDVMSPVFGINAYWFRQEFAKTRGMVHLHGLCWRSDKQPYALIHEALERGLTDDECAEELAIWAANQFGISASHPAGKDHNGESKKNLWPLPEGTAPAPPEQDNPLQKLLIDVSSTQESLLEAYILLTNRVNLHRCSETYCLKRTKTRNKKLCRMEFPKPLRSVPAIVHDKNNSQGNVKGSS